MGLKFPEKADCALPFQHWELIFLELDWRMRRIIANKDSPVAVCR